MKITRKGSTEKMLSEFKERINELENKSEVTSTTIISSSQMYADVGGGFGGVIGEMYSEDDLRSMWDRDHDDDPCMAEYNSYEAWMSDNINNGWLKKVDASCHAGTADIDDDLEDVMGEKISCSFDVNSIDVDKLYDIADTYTTSSPVSGEWGEETKHEQQAIADAFNISLDDAKEVMIKILGFPEEDFVTASTSIKCHEYVDETGDAFGEPGIMYTEDDLRKYFEENRLSDPVLEGYATFEDWLTDTIDNTNLRFAYVDGGCHTDVEASADYNILSGFDDIEDVSWEELDSKLVKDADGFFTDYTLYHNTVTDQYVAVFGDKDIYRPEDGEFDAEFDTAEEAFEWFDSYTGLYDFLED